MNYFDKIIQSHFRNKTKIQLYNLRDYFLTIVTKRFL